MTPRDLPQRRRRMRRLVAALAVTGLGACQSNFESASTVNSFRIFAVQKDKPYAHPGDTVHLTMLLDNGGTYEDGGMRHDPIQIGWAGGCENPPGDAYSQCIIQIVEKARKGEDLGRATLEVFGQFGLGLEFDLKISDDIIKRRPAPANPAQPKYGSSFVLFAACAGGQIVPAKDLSSALPIVCMRNGKQLGPDRFIVGYTEVFAYEKLTNSNPVVTGFQVSDDKGTVRTVQPDCVGAACIALEREEFRILNLSFLDQNGGSTPSPRPDAGAPPPSRSDAGARSPDGGTGVADASTEAGKSGSARDGSVPSTGMDASGSGMMTPEGGSSGPGTRDAGGMTSSVPPPDCVRNATEPRCMDLCTTGDRDTCPKHTVKLILDERRTREQDGAQSVITGMRLEEQMWINYYTDAGKLEHEVKLLNDATTGWNEAHSADLRAPLELKPFHVWAVAHDNRGGVQWARVTLSTRVPAQGFQ